MKYDLKVFPGKVGDLRKKYSAPRIAMDHHHPMKDIKRTLSEYLYAFKASGNPNRWDPSNVAFYYDLREQLENDDEYQEEPTVNRFVLCLEKTATQWERDEFRVAERSKKRAHTSFFGSAPDRNSHSAGYDKGKSNKKTESSSASQINALPAQAGSGSSRY